MYLMREARRRGMSGVALKDESAASALRDGSAVDIDGGAKPADAAAAPDEADGQT
jgi:hypothetical protein